MLQRILSERRSSATLLCFSVLLGVSLSGCMSSAERRHVNLQEDASICAGFGGRYGSPQYNNCMLAQQHRRDVAGREALEQSALTAQIARDSQVIAERAKRQRCDRDPDRRECKR